MSQLNDFLHESIFHWILATRLVIAALYKHMNEPMKLLWNESMKMNTVHVDDVVAAAFALALNPLANKQCYNIVDDSQSTQGTISNVLANIFNIKVDYWGEGLSNLSKVRIENRTVKFFKKFIEIFLFFLGF